MRYADLSLSTQLILIALLVAAAAAVLTRSLIFLRREWSGGQPFYSGQLDRSATSVARKFSVAGRPCFDVTLGRFSVSRAFNADQRAVWVLRGDFPDLVADDQLRLGPLSHSERSKARRVFELLLGDHDDACALVAIRTRGNRLGYGEGFDTPPRVIPLNGVFASLYPPLLGAELGPLR